MASVEIKSIVSNNLNRQSKISSIESELSVLKCMYLNATSLDNKLDEFKVVVSTHCPHLVAVSETWFKSYSVFNVPGYNLYRKDRNDGRRG